MPRLLGLSLISVKRTASLPTAILLRIRPYEGIKMLVFYLANLLSETARNYTNVKDNL